MRRWILLLLLVLGAGSAIPTVRSYVVGLIGGPPAAIRRLSRQVLQPLGSKTSISDAAARKELAALTTRVAAERSSPDFARRTQALRLLGQALNERSAYANYVQAGNADNRLDEIPGDWHLIGHSDKKVNLTEIKRQQRSSFWNEARLRQWRSRCDYYQAAIDALLTVATPAPNRTF